ncbi:MAG: DUF2721 domain-containing protein [Planctomycetota bacterium]
MQAGDGGVFDPGVIAELAAPAVIIPACGLLCLSTNARMQAVLNRLRALHKERIEAWVDDPGENERKKLARDVRIVGLGWQTAHMLNRLNQMRVTMMLLFGAVICLLACSAFVGLSQYAAWSGTAAVVSFVAATALMAAGMAVSLHEMAIGLRAANYEHERVVELCEREDP